MGQTLLRIENISKSFGITKACSEISMCIESGEIHGLIGENGSGKSTLTGLVYGLLEPDNGTLFLEDVPYIVQNQIQANEIGIAAIIQETGTLDGLTVAQNLFLGKEKQFMKRGSLDIRAMNQAADKLLDLFQMNDIKASTLINKYNFEARKIVEIIRAISIHPKLLIVDETTTALSQNGRAVLYQQMENVKAYGGSVIFISHDMDEILDKTDRISVLRDGKFITTVNTAEVSSDKLKELMVGRKVSHQYYRTDYESKISEKIVLTANNISKEGILQNISFSLHQGEILGIGGLSDCGIHEIGKALFGADYEVTGNVKTREGVLVNSIPKAIQQNIAYTSKNRDQESVILDASICDNICLMVSDKLKTGPLISLKKMRQEAEIYTEKLSVKMESINQDVSSLSGGNKQKVVIAKWLAKEPEIYILDSPTRGIDIKVKADIYQVMDNLRREGKSIIMISEEIMELIGMCDRILILKDGRINGEFYRSPELKEQDIIRKMV